MTDWGEVVRRGLDDRERDRFFLAGPRAGDEAMVMDALDACHEHLSDAWFYEVRPSWSEPFLGALVEMMRAKEWPE